MPGGKRGPELISVIGLIVLLVMVFGGFAFTGGNLGVVMHALPHEMLIIGGAALGARSTAADAFAAFYRLEELRRARDHLFRRIDALLLPTAPTAYTVKQVLADPIGLNSRLGTYTNFVNLLDLCALALPAVLRPGGRPFGITLIAPAGHDAAPIACSDGTTSRNRSPDIESASHATRIVATIAARSASTRRPVDAAGDGAAGGPERGDDRVVHGRPVGGRLLVHGPMVGHPGRTRPGRASREPI